MKSLTTMVLLFSSMAFGETNLGIHTLKCFDGKSSMGVEVRVSGKSKTEYETVGARVLIIKKKSMWNQVLVDDFTEVSVSGMEFALSSSNEPYLAALRVDVGSQGYFQYEGSTSRVHSTLSNFNVLSEELKCEYYFSAPRPISGGNH